MGELTEGIMNLTGANDPEFQPRNLESELRDTFKNQQLFANPSWLLTDEYAPKYAGTTANIVSQLSPQFLQLLKSMNPGGFKLLDTLQNQAQSDLDLGASLDPAQTRMVNQSVRKNAASRGMGWGPSDLFSEAFAQTDRGRQLQDSRRNFAAGAANMGNSFMSPAFMAAMGIAPDAVHMTAPKFDPFGSSYAQDVNSTNNNELATAEIISKMNRQAGGKQTGDGVGQLAMMAM